MKSYNLLFLDDDKGRIDKLHSDLKHDPAVPRIYVANTAEEAIRILESTPLDVVSLDHDLGGEIYVDSSREDCGMAVVRYMIAKGIRVGAVVVHSYNPPASDTMVKSLREAGYNTYRKPFTSGIYYGVNQWQRN